ASPFSSPVTLAPCTAARTLAAASSARSAAREPSTTGTPAWAQRVASPAPSAPVPPMIGIGSPSATSAPVYGGRIATGCRLGPVMGGSTQQPARAQAGRGVWELVEAQHGVVSRRQLRALGYSRHAIGHRISIGRLWPVFRGVYAVGRPDLSSQGRWMAAVLACG